jgi:hypothetical protein
MWWWSMDWPAPWMLFGPIVMIVVLAVCIAAVAFIARRGMSHLSMACCGAGFAPGKQESGGVAVEGRAGAPRIAGGPAFEAYRADTLRRLEQEQLEFEGFLDHLRTAKDKAEFAQFMAERKPVPPSQQRQAQV